MHMNRNWIYKQAWAIVAGLMLVELASCVTEPVTGRRQFNVIPIGQEIEMGLASFNQMKKETPINRDPKINALVQQVGQRIASVATLPNAQWEFVVFESKEANAFCLPGGKVGVYTGILPITQTEEGLATVIGHEVAHAAARHGGERMTVALGLQGGQMAASELSSKSTNYQAVAMQAYGLGSQLLVALPHSREQESAADRIGLTYMAQAGYRPEAAIEFWRRFMDFNKAGGGGDPWFLRTHPVDEDRIRDLQKWLPEAKAASQLKPVSK